MPNDDFTVICPYYYKELGNDVFCEGIAGDPDIPVDKSFFKQTFTDRKSRNDCIRKYCASFRYSECRIAAIKNAVHQMPCGK